MAYLQLSSNNPKLGYVIGKNPASGMQIRELRQGRAFGWFSKDGLAYNIFFKDSDTEVSYKSYLNEDFEFLNKTRYGSAMFPLNAIQDFFSTTVKKDIEEDAEGFENTLTINMMNIRKTQYIHIFQQHIEGFELVATEVAKHYYKVEIKTTKTVRKLLNYVSMFCLFNALKNENNEFNSDDGIVERSLYSDDAVAKYLKSLDIIDPPYFVRYVFKVNLLRNPKIFDKYKSILETTSHHKSVQLTRGNNAINRKEMVKKLLGNITNSVVDIGSGEGFFVFDLIKRVPLDKTYFAIDIDEEMRRIVTNKAERKSIENIQVCESWDNFLGVAPNEPLDVLMVEVIEHMPIEEARALVESVLTDLSGKVRVIITTPNKNFNRYYDMAEDHIRHNDHKFEFNSQEFADFINSIVAECNGKFDVKYLNVGDMVDGESTSSGVIITKE